MEWIDAALDALELARKAALDRNDAVHSALAERHRRLLSIAEGSAPASATLRQAAEAVGAMSIHVNAPFREAVQSALRADQHDLHALRKSAKQVNRAISVYGKPGPKALLRDRPWIVTVAPIGSSRGYRKPHLPARGTYDQLSDEQLNDLLFWTEEINAGTVVEGPGSDHALAAVMCGMAHLRPESLKQLISWDRARHRPVLTFPGQEPDLTRTVLPHQFRLTSGHELIGIRSPGNRAIGVSFIAKGYAAALSMDRAPFYVDDPSMPLAARVKEAMSYLTGTPATWEHPRLDVDDDDLAASLGGGRLVVACSPAFRPGSPNHDVATRCRLITARREQAYAVLGVDDRRKVRLHHPLGYSTNISLGDFRTVFPDVIAGPPPPRLGERQPAPETFDYLATGLGTEIR